MTKQAYTGQPGSFSLDGGVYKPVAYKPEIDAGEVAAREGDEAEAHDLAATDEDQQAATEQTAVKPVVADTKAAKAATSKPKSEE